MSSSATLFSRIRFGPFDLDAASGELRKSGIPIKLRVQAAEVLRMLTERAGQLVTREEIRERLWSKDTFVDFERSINFCINQIRGALGDDAEKPRYVETLPRRGYRFIAPVTVEVLQAPAPTVILVQPAGEHSDYVLSSNPSLEKPFAQVLRWERKGSIRWLAAAAVTLSVFALVWPRNRQPSALTEIKERQVTASSSDLSVTSDAISPDGKYLAYSDAKGIHLKLLSTGETRTLSDVPSEAYFAWFPDSTRFLASQVFRPGIWAFSVMGGESHLFREEGMVSLVSRDGSLVSYTTNKGRVGDREIWIVGADGKNSRKFLGVAEDSSVQQPSWSPDDQRILYLLQRQVAGGLEVNIESRTLRGGPPVVVYSELAPTPERMRLMDFVWLPGRIILSLAAADSDLVNSFSARCDLWELHVDPTTGQGSGPLRRLTNWHSGDNVVNLYATADGKKLSIFRMTDSVSLFLGDLATDGKHISSTRRFTTTEGWNNAPAWAADSRAVFFESNRDGHVHLFRQQLSGDTAQPVMQESAETSDAIISPDGSFLYYLAAAHSAVGGAPTPVQIMRIPTEGGVPQPLLTTHIYDSPRCARAPSRLCAIAQPSEDRRQMTFVRLDSATNPAGELARIDVDPDADYAWDLSPNGEQIVVLKRVPRSDGKIFAAEGPLRIVSLTGKPLREIHPRGTNSFHEYVDWAPDSRGLILSRLTEDDPELVYLDLEGNLSPLWHQKGVDVFRGVPSPDGRHIAMLGRTHHNNVWVLENF